MEAWDCATALIAWPADGCLTEELRGLLAGLRVSVVGQTMHAGETLARIAQERIGYLFMAPSIAGADAPAIMRAMRTVHPERLPYPVIVAAGGGYIPVLKDGCVLKPPLTREQITAALQAGTLERRSADGPMALRAQRLLLRLEVPDGAGRRYLARAIAVAALDQQYRAHLTGRMYPMLAAAYAVSARQVESAMRRAIDRAWTGGAIEGKYELFINTIDAQRGKPTCGGLIARLSDILRLEEDD